MKKRLVIWSTNLALLCCILLPSFALAGDITVRPFLIDETLTPRDGVTRTITVTNHYDQRKLIIYATVNEISVDNEGEIKEFMAPVMTDRTTTVTSWIEISRGRIEVPAGETREVPLTIHVHPYAEPGEYHAFIGMVSAPNRPTAEAVAMAGDADGVILKITISDTRQDNMRISNIDIDRFVMDDEHKIVGIEVENMGDLETMPEGEIIFYNNRGVEVASAEVNTGNIIVGPGETKVLDAVIPIDDSLGRYKAKVSLEYGANQRASLQDTAFFYLLPMHLLLMVIGGVLLIAIIVALLFRRALMAEHQDEDGDEVAVFVREGHSREEKDHDIDLSKTK